MKNIIYLLIIALLFFSCKSSTKNTNKDTVATKNPNNQHQNLIAEFKPIIQGNWVKKDYIDKVIATRSPATAEDMTSGETEMIIKTDHIKGDSLNVSVGWHNHEGGELMMRFKPGKTKSSIQLGDFDLCYLIQNKDTCLVVYDFDKEKKTTKITKYIKVLSKKDEILDDAIDYLINKGIISGRYSSVDSIGNKSDITFTNEGKVMGFANYKNYALNKDLMSDPMDNLDEIFFSDQKHQYLISYTFKITADTLKLFDSYANADSTELIVGRLKYKLVKKK